MSNQQQPPPVESSKSSLLRLVGIIILVMLIPIIPFLLGGEFLESSIEKWIQSDLSQSFRLTAVVVSLMADIFLPVPSSAVITFAGATCGIIPATLAAWVGLTLGGMFGYELSRLWGSKLLNRLSSKQDCEQMQNLVAQHGSWAIILTRPLPILGETAVLIVGSLLMQRLPFYFSLTISNLAISFVYASFGNWFSSSHLLPWVIAASLVIPVLLTVIVRFKFSK